MEFRPMRRHRQELNAAESVAILENATSGVLGLIGDGGYPYTVPMSHVYKDGKLFFHSAVEGHKVDAILNDSRCSFCVVAKDDVKPSEYTTYFRSVIAFGKIHIVNDNCARLEALQLLGQKFRPGHHSTLQKEIDNGINHVLVLRMDIEHLSGKEAIELVRQRNHN